MFMVLLVQFEVSQLQKCNYKFRMAVFKVICKRAGNERNKLLMRTPDIGL